MYFCHSRRAVDSLGAASFHTDVLVRGPGPNLGDVGLVTLPDASVNVFPGVGRVEAANDLDTRRSHR